MEDDPDFAEDRDEYLAEGIFWVPDNARWNYIAEKSKLPEIGQIIDEALDSIEKENDTLRGVLPKNYSRPELDKRILGEIVDLFSNINVGGTIAKEKDVLGRVYEYFLGKFAANEGKGGGEFYTPKSIVTLMVDMIEPYKGYVYDPACGSGGMFVQSLKFVEEHSGSAFDISVYGQESNPTTWKLAKMNLAIRGIENNLGSKNADTFHEDLHAGLKADFVLANGSLSSNTSSEGEIRKNILEADLVDCIVALPDKLFYTTGIPVCIWFFNRDKKNNGETLFIDARKLGTMVNRRLRELTDEDIKTVADVYHAFNKNEGYEDKQGFCKRVSLDEIKANDYILTPERYVGIEEEEDDGEPFEEKMDRLTKTLSEQFKKSKELEDEIRKQLGGIGYEL